MRAIKQLPESRFWSDKQAASRLGRSASWLSNNYDRLRQLGFPAKDPAIGGFPKEAVERFIDNRSNIIRDDDPSEQIISMLMKDREFHA